jgi:hypothetical protein
MRAQVQGSVVGEEVSGLPSVIHVINEGDVALSMEDGNRLISFQPKVPTPCTRTLFEKIKPRNLDPKTKKPVFRMATEEEITQFRSKAEAKVIGVSDEPFHLAPPQADENLVEAAIEQWDVQAQDVSRILVEGCTSEATLTAIIAKAKGDEREELRSIALARLQDVRELRDKAGAAAPSS